MELNYFSRVCDFAADDNFFNIIKNGTYCILSYKIYISLIKYAERTRNMNFVLNQIQRIIKICVIKPNGSISKTQKEIMLTLTVRWVLQRQVIRIVCGFGRRAIVVLIMSVSHCRIFVSYS
jgi:hypothetical protein